MFIGLLPSEGSKIFFSVCQVNLIIAFIDVWLCWAFVPVCWLFPGFGRCRFNPWVGKIPWRREWQPAPVFLPGKFHGQKNLVGYSPWGHKESDMTEQLTLWFSDKETQCLISDQQVQRVQKFRKEAKSYPWCSQERITMTDFLDIIEGQENADLSRWRKYSIPEFLSGVQKRIKMTTSVKAFMFFS